LTLYINCAVLCQRLHLGDIQADPFALELLRSVGLAICLGGLYLTVRGMFRPLVAAISGASPAIRNDDAPDGRLSDDTASGADANSHRHVPLTRLSFIREHPVCAGWLVILTGLPLVFVAWFPLVAIPGIFVGMNWLFSSVGKKPTAPVLG
jgi:hypothetical protein